MRSAVAVCALLLGLLACGGPGADALTEARALQESGRFEESLEGLRTLLKSRPEDPEADLMGAALLATGQPSRAPRPLWRAMESPQWTANSILLSSALLMTGNSEEVVQAADRVLQITPDDVAALDLRRADRP